MAAACPPDDLRAARRPDRPHGTGRRYIRARSRGRHVRLHDAKKPGHPQFFALSPPESAPERLPTRRPCFHAPQAERRPRDILPRGLRFPFRDVSPDARPASVPSANAGRCGSPDRSSARHCRQHASTHCRCRARAMSSVGRRYRPRAGTRVVFR